VSNAERDIPGVIARPPLIFLGAVVAGLALDWLVPLPFASGGLGGAFQYWLGGALIVAGLAAAATAVWQFHRAGTNAPTWRPTTALVTDGLYRYSRNPIYLAMSVSFLGIAIAVNTLWLLIMLVPTLLIMHRGVILREERYLEAKFGDAYRRYTAAVRRWL